MKVVNYYRLGCAIVIRRGNRSMMDMGISVI